MKGPDYLEWTAFRLGDLFVISKGTRLTKAQMIPGEINYIGASSMNNGVTARIGPSLSGWNDYRLLQR